MKRYEIRLSVTIYEEKHTIPWMKYLLKYREIFEQSPESLLQKMFSSPAKIEIMKIIKKRS